MPAYPIYLIIAVSGFKIKGRLLLAVLRIGWRERMVCPCAILPEGGILFQWKNLTSNPKPSRKTSLK